MQTLAAEQHETHVSVLIELFPGWPGETFPLYAIRPSRRLPPAAVEAFLDFCGEICEAVEPTPEAS
jgi:DNA-binding transcriptional LysR family regulator